MCALQCIIIAECLESGIHELDPTPWLHVIKRLPNDGAMIIKAADSEAQVDVVEWMGVYPFIVLRVFFEKLHV